MSTEIIVGPTGPTGPTGPRGEQCSCSYTEDQVECIVKNDDDLESRARFIPKHPVYGFILDMDESDPDSMIKYTDDNEFYTPARMDFTNDTFDYGDWANAWFIKECKPCILNFDGTVECYLDPDDYNYSCTWNDDGTYTRGSQVDIDENCVGNVMVEMPPIQVEINTDHPRKPIFRFYDSPELHNVHASEALSINTPFYLAAYEGTDDGSKIRSISGQNPCERLLINNAFAEHIEKCRANNVSDDNRWDIGTFSERMLITLLLMLIGKSTNSQAVFGHGNNGYVQIDTDNGYSETLIYSARRGTYSITFDDGVTYRSEEYLWTGTMDNRGLFWGSSASSLGVKVFGIENFWGNIAKRLQGLIIDSINSASDPMVFKYKIGRTASANDIISGSGYSSLSGISYDSTEDSGSAWFIDMYVGKFGLLPKNKSESHGSSSTYYCDRCTVNNPIYGVLYLNAGGENSLTPYDNNNGLFCYAFRHLDGSAGWRPDSTSHEYPIPVLAGTYISYR